MFCVKSHLYLKWVHQYLELSLTWKIYKPHWHFLQSGTTFQFNNTMQWYTNHSLFHKSFWIFHFPSRIVALYLESTYNKYSYKWCWVYCLINLSHSAKSLIFYRSYTIKNILSWNEKVMKMKCHTLWFCLKDPSRLQRTVEW